jgi:integrase/recombinase XerD
MKKFVSSSEWIASAQRDYAPALARYRRSLESSGLKPSTIDSYVWRVGTFLKFAKSDKPTVSALKEFRECLLDKKLSLSGINNSCFAVKRFYKMLGQDVDFEFVKPHDSIPYYFNEEDVAKIFHACRNIKHRAMFELLFYSCLRASELCGLDVEDVNLEAMTLRLKETKRGDRNDIAYINRICANTLMQYLQIRPPLEIDGRKPLFYTDFGGRWDHKSIHYTFMRYKKLAGINKPGAVHVFSRHTPATIMIAHGCDIRIVKELMRHNDIRTTLRYAHVSDKTMRERYEQCLTL